MVTDTGVLFRRWIANDVDIEDIPFLMLLYRNARWPMSIVRFTVLCC